MEVIKKVSLSDIVDYASIYFPNFKVSENPFEFTYAYFLDDKIIGFIDFSLIYEKAEINYIAVDEEYRGKGIAQKLFDTFIANTNDVETISLEVKCNNDRAVNFYLKNGFEKKAIRENYYNGEDAYLMVKEIR